MTGRFLLSLLILAFTLASCAPRTPGKSFASSSGKDSLPPPKQSVQALSLEKPPSIPDLARGKLAPPAPEQAEETIRETARQWFYGKGVGRTALNVGTVVLFPPYVIYVLGNAGLQLAGFEPLYLTDALPEGPRKGVLEVYDDVTSVPGRINAAIADEQFYDR